MRLGSHGTIARTAGSIALLVLLAVTATGCRSLLPLHGSEFDLGFLACRDTTLHGESRVRLLGPIYESREARDGRTFHAVRPLFSNISDPLKDTSRSELLWPLGVARRQGNQKTWRFANAMYTNFDTDDLRSRYRFWILPVFFMGRDKNGEEYLGLFPIAGSANEILGMDESDFFLFPLFMQSKQQGVESIHLLWPVFERSKGEGVYAIRVAPFYARCEKYNSWERRFLMWPLWTSTRYYYGRRGAGESFLLMPFFGHRKTDYDEAWTILPPFARWTVTPRGVEIDAPWPVFHMRTGRIHKFHIRPLIGVETQRGMRSCFFLWPIVRTMRQELPNEFVARNAILPFYQECARRHKCSVTGEIGPIVAHDMKIWPVLSYQKDNEATYLRIPELWPVIDATSVDRNYAPLWTLYSRETYRDSFEEELLWGLARYRKTPSETRGSIFPLVSWRTSPDNESDREWSLLKGLLGYTHDEEGRHLRLFYVLKLCKGEDARRRRQAPQHLSEQVREE
jgi:hypothetical protein